jgi:hypothetical protein
MAMVESRMDAAKELKQKVPGFRTAVSGKVEEDT